MLWGLLHLLISERCWNYVTLTFFVIKQYEQNYCINTGIIGGNIQVLENCIINTSRETGRGSYCLPHFEQSFTVYNLQNSINTQYTVQREKNKLIHWSTESVYTIIYVYPHINIHRARWIISIQEGAMLGQNKSLKQITDASSQYFYSFQFVLYGHLQTGMLFLCSFQLILIH